MSKASHQHMSLKRKDNSAALPANQRSLFQTGIQKKPKASSDTDSDAVHHSVNDCQFILGTGDRRCFLAYDLSKERDGGGTVWTIWETFVPPPMRGRGVAERLCHAAFAAAIQRGARVIPQCTYVQQRYLSQFPDMLKATQRQPRLPLTPTSSPSSSQSMSVNSGYQYASLLLNSGSPLAAGHLPLPHHPILGANHFAQLLQSFRNYRLSQPTIQSLSTLFATSQGLKASQFHSVFRQLFDSVFDSEERDRFVNHVVPFALSCIEQLPTLFPSASISLLKSNTTASVTVTQTQIAALLSCALFSIHAHHKPSANKKKSNKSMRFNSANCEHLFGEVADSARLRSQAIEKLRCLFNYFYVLSQRCQSQQGRQSLANTVVSYHRRSLTESPQSLIQRIQSSSLPLAPLSFPSTALIEEDNIPTHSIHLDFANKFIGGGVLTQGCVQEEILFLICPECLPAILFSEVMEANECLVIVGAERYSQYKGYGNSFAFDGVYHDSDPLGRTSDGNDRRRRAILAIDALYYHNHRSQFARQSIERELLKCFTGFSVPTEWLTDGSASEKNYYQSLSTGNWGCGAFNGDIPLKSIIQLIAASFSHRQLRYFAFGDAKTRGFEPCTRHLWSVGVSAGELCRCMFQYAERVSKQVSGVEPTIYDYLMKVRRDSATGLITVGTCTVSNTIGSNCTSDSKEEAKEHEELSDISKQLSFGATEAEDEESKCASALSLALDDSTQPFIDEDSLMGDDSPAAAQSTEETAAAVMSVSDSLELESQPITDDIDASHTGAVESSLDLELEVVPDSLSE